jgi:hypothetical protein
MSFTTPARAAIESLLYPEAKQDLGEDPKVWEGWAKANGYWEFETLRNLRESRE